MYCVCVCVCLYAETMSIVETRVLLSEKAERESNLMNFLKAKGLIDPNNPNNPNNPDDNQELNTIINDLNTTNDDDDATNLSIPIPHSPAKTAGERERKQKGYDNGFTSPKSALLSPYRSSRHNPKNPSNNPYDYNPYNNPTPGKTHPKPNRTKGSENGNGGKTNNSSSSPSQASLDNPNHPQLGHSPTPGSNNTDNSSTFFLTDIPVQSQAQQRKQQKDQKIQQNKQKQLENLRAEKRGRKLTNRMEMRGRERQERREKLQKQYAEQDRSKREKRAKMVS